MGKKKNENKVFGARIKPRLQKAVKEFCNRNKILIEGFFEEALIRELERRRNGVK